MSSTERAQHVKDSNYPGNLKRLPSSPPPVEKHAPTYEGELRNIYYASAELNGRPVEAEVTPIVNEKYPKGRLQVRYRDGGPIVEPIEMADDGYDGAFSSTESIAHLLEDFEGPDVATEEHEGPNPFGEIGGSFTASMMIGGDFYGVRNPSVESVSYEPYSTTVEVEVTRKEGEKPVARLRVYEFNDAPGPDPWENLSGDPAEKPVESKSERGTSRRQQTPGHLGRAAVEPGDFDSRLV